MGASVAGLALTMLACKEAPLVDAGVPAGLDAAAPFDGGDAPRDAAAAIDAASVPDSGAAPDAALDAGPDGGPDAGPVSELRPAEAPPRVVFPAVVDVLTVVLRTDTERAASTDDGVELCLSDTACWRLDTPGVDDRESGQLDVYHLEGVALSRAEVDQVTIRSPAGTGDDRWTLDCLELRFDGEPVYCADGLRVRLGSGSSSGEVSSWTDPAGLHEACTTCQAGRLTLPPLLGPPRPDRVSVWVRTDAKRRVGLRMSETEDVEDGPVVAWADPDPRDDFTAVLEVSGLRPGREYKYRVEVEGGTEQPARPIRTAPTPSAPAPARVVIGSCTKEPEQPIFGPMLGWAPDLFLFVGDNHYGNTRFLEAQRWNYRWQRARPERGALFANVPTLTGWDDHDFVGNNSDGTCLGRQEALRSVGEYWLNPAAGTTQTPGNFFRYRWGPVEFFVTDGRTYRPDVADPLKDCVADPNPPTLDPAYGLLGQAQTDWLVDALASSDALFKLVSNGSRWTAEGSRDSWASFLPARDALFARIAALGVEGVVLVSGDVHRTELRTIVRDGAYDLPELTSSALGYDPNLCRAPDRDLEACFDDSTSFVSVEVDPTLEDPTLTARIHDVNGSVQHTWTILRSALSDRP